MTRIAFDKGHKLLARLSTTLLAAGLPVVLILIGVGVYGLAMSDELAAGERANVLLPLSVASVIALAILVVPALGASRPAKPGSRRDRQEKCRSGQHC